MTNTFHRYKPHNEPVPGYRIEACLGSGGFGEVWKGAGPGGTEVAVKIIDLTGQQGVQEFRSLRLVKKCHHPNLVPLHGYWLKDEEGKLIDEAALGWSEDSSGNPSENTQATQNFNRPVELIVVMGLGSKCLHKRLLEVRQDGLPGVPPQELLDYMEGASRGIDFLNGQIGIVHGDIKPHNILVVGDAAAVCDFGLARAVETLRKTSMAPMTVAYAAPESFRGKPTIKSDQYSLAITYVELRTGLLPFDEGLSPFDLMNTHVTGHLDLQRLPPYEREVIRRATALNPDERWNTCRDFARALQRAFQSDPQAQLLAGSPYDEDLEVPGFIATLITDAPPGPMPHEYLRQTQGGVNHGVTPRTITSPPPSSRGSIDRTGPPPQESLHGRLGRNWLTRVENRRQLAYIGSAVGLLLIVALVGWSWLASVEAARQEQAQLEQFTLSATQIDALIEQKKFSEAIALLERTRGATPDRDDWQARLNDRRLKLRSQWLAAAQQAIGQSQTDEARQLIEAFSRAFPGDSQTSRLLAEAARSKTPSNEAKFSEFLTLADNARQSKDPMRALDLLLKPPTGLSSEQSQQVDQRLGIVRKQLIDLALDKFRQGQFAETVAQCKTLIDRLPKPAELYLLRARALLAQNQAPAARQDLTAIASESELSPPQRELAELLKVQLELLSGQLRGEAALQRLLNMKLLADSPASVESPWTPTPAEKSSLQQVRRRLIDQAVHLWLEDDRDPPFDTRYDLLFAAAPAMQQRMLMRKALFEMESQRWAPAQATVDQLLKLIGETKSTAAFEAAALEALIKLRNPAASAEQRKAALAEAQRVELNVGPDLRGMLCQVVSVLARNEPEAYRETGIDYLLAAIQAEPDRNELYRMLRDIYGSNVWTQRIKARLEDPTRPTTAQWQQLLADATAAQAIATNDQDVRLDASRVEALMQLGQRVPPTMAKSLIKRAIGRVSDPYLNYVAAQAAVSAKVGDINDWPDEAANLILRAYDKGVRPAELMAPFRQQMARQVLVDAARGKRRIDGNTLLSNIETDPYRTLYDNQNVQKWMRFAGTINNAPPTVGEHVNLTLTQYFPARTSPASIAALAEYGADELGPDALYIWLLNYKLHRAEGLSGLVRSVQLLRTSKVEDGQVIELYNSVLKTALSEQGSGAVASSLAGEFAQLLAERRKAPWPIADIDAEIETLLGRAIAVHSNEARYVLLRAEQRATRAQVDAAGAKADFVKAGSLVKSDADKAWLARLMPVMQKLDTGAK